VVTVLADRRGVGEVEGVPLEQVVRRVLAVPQVHLAQVLRRLARLPVAG
jgi:hypothetical protein